MAKNLIVAGPKSMLAANVAHVNEWIDWAERKRGLSSTTVYTYRCTYVALLEHLGGTSHAYTWAEFKQRYERHYGAL